MNEVSRFSGGAVRRILFIYYYYFIYYFLPFSETADNLQQQKTSFKKTVDDSAN